MAGIPILCGIHRSKAGECFVLHYPMAYKPNEYYRQVRIIARRPCTGVQEFSCMHCVAATILMELEGRKV